MISRTTVTKKEELNPRWHHIDVEGKTLGRISTEIAKLLIGKDKVTFTRNLNTGDRVVITNAAKITVTGNKLKQKTYYRHTGFPKGLREETLQELLKRKPTEVIKKSVERMLPQNKLKKDRLSNLFIYAGNEHPHAAQLNSKETNNA